MIDPFAAIIAYLSTDADLIALIGPRIGARHRYGLRAAGLTGWANGASALVIRPTSGDEQDDAGQHRLRVECIAYGDDPTIATQIMQRVDTIGQALTRTPVTLPDAQTALIYWFSAVDSPELDRDPDLQNADGDRLDLVRQPYRLAVAATAIVP